MTAFEKGYRAFTDMTGANIAAFGGEEYVGNVENAIDELSNAINELSKDGKSKEILKGIAAEHWHSHTHNIDAAVKGVSARTEVLESHVVGSVDVKGNWKDSDYSLKYHKDGDASAKAQAEIYRAKYEAFRNTQIEKGKQPLSYEDYFQQEYEKYLSECARKNRTPQNINEVFPGYKDYNNPLYMEQHRLIAKDQLEEARAWLNRRIIEESNGGRPDQVKRYQETLDKLTDRIKSNEGSESIPISKEEAEEIARLAKEENFDPADWGLTTEELIQWEHIMKQANKAGLSAAVISVVLEVAPELIKIIMRALRDEGVDIDEFKRLGFISLKSSTLGYIRGSVAAAVTISCKAGKLGESLKSADPTVIGAVVALTMNTIQNATLMAFGHMNTYEFANRCIQDLLTASCSFAVGIAMKEAVSKLMGAALQAALPQLPVVAFMLGSFIGSVIGSFIYHTTYSCMMSYSINSGCTFFGLVKQDYVLPDDIIEDLGLELFEYEKFIYEEFEHETFEFEEFEFEEFEYESINISIIRRGVIGVNCIGYV